MAPGATLWAGGHHLVVMDVTLTFIETGDLYSYWETGAKVGKVSGGIETCQGDFPEYGLHAISHSVIVP
jgi:hypothetical protein